MNLSAPIPNVDYGDPNTPEARRERLAAEARARCAKRGHLVVTGGDRCLDCHSLLTPEPPRPLALDD